MEHRLYRILHQSNPAALSPDDSASWQELGLGPHPHTLYDRVLLFLEAFSFQDLLLYVAKFFPQD